MSQHGWIILSHTRLRNTREPNRNRRTPGNIHQKTFGVVVGRTWVEVVADSNLVEEVLGGILVVVGNRKTRDKRLVQSISKLMGWGKRHICILMFSADNFLSIETQNITHEDLSLTMLWQHFKITC